MRIECNGDRVSMSKNEYRQVMNKQNDYKQQRDELIKDVEKLREELRMHIQCNDELGRVNKLKDKQIKDLKFKNAALKLQADEYFELWQDAIKK